MPQVTIDTVVLEMLLKHASSASRLVGCIDDHADAVLALGPLADHIDAIVHELSELLGNPHLIAAPVPSACSTEPALGEDELTWPRVALRMLDAPGGAS